MISVANEEILRQNGIVLQYLANMRPKLVISELMKKLNFSLDSPIESYKFCAVMDSMILVRKPFVIGSKFHLKGTNYRFFFFFLNDC